MRSYLAFVLPPLCALGAFVACGSEDAADEPTADAASDAAVTPGPAAVDASPEVDAGATDADATPTGITVAIQDAPTAGVEVLFHDAAGAVLARAQTDGTGRASSVVSGIATVTVVQVASNRALATTFTNVAPGDVLTLRALLPAAKIGQLAVTTAALPGAAASTSVSVGPCTTTFPTGTTGTVNLFATCIGSPPTALLAETTVAGEHRYAFTRQGPALPVDGGTLTTAIPAPWTPSSTTVLTVTGLPAQTTLAVGLAAIAGKVVFPFGSDTTSGAPVNFRFATNFGDALEATASLQSGAAVTSISQRYGLVGATTLDWSRALPLLGSPAVDKSEPARPLLSWTGDTRDADGLRVSFVWVPGSGRTHIWNFVLPPGATSVKAPVLPADLAFAPTAEQIVGALTPAAVEAVEADVFDGPAAFRQQQGAVLGAKLVIDPTPPALPANGVLRQSVGGLLL